MRREIRLWWAMRHTRIAAEHLRKALALADDDTPSLAVIAHVADTVKLAAARRSL